MSWERRRNRRIYYRAHRVGSRVVKTYFGSGEKAELMADLDQAERTHKIRERANIQKLDREFHIADDLQTEFDALSKLLVDAVLICRGYYRHNYGPWRRRRNVEHD